ncbi:MAG: hypothetical protein HY722_02685 [Planctomycetes bacterium]|nr:hypothetical protein [Planctomycetota bacterium]
MSARGAATLALALALALVAVTPAPGDIVHLTGGGKVTGEILEETEAGLRVRTPAGVVTLVPWEEVARVERGETPEAIYQAKRKALRDGDAAALYDLAQWCRANRLPQRYVACLEACVAAESDHAEARLELGYRREGGRWLTEREYHETRGDVLHEGNWRTPEEVDRLDQGLEELDGDWVSPERYEAPLAARERARRRPGFAGTATGGDPTPTAGAPRRELPSDVQELLALARARNAEKRRAAWAKLLESGPEARAALAEVVQGWAWDEAEGFEAWVKSEREAWRPVLASQVVARRKEAMDFIMDPARYPEEDHGAVAQPEVDRLVGRLRDVYERPHVYLEAEHAAYRERLGAARAVLEECRETLRKAGSATGDLPDMGTLAASTDGALQMDRYPTSKAEVDLIREGVAILKENVGRKTSEDAEERACVLATNRYRLMFGLKALRSDERLVQGARKHSDDMRVRQYFDHISRDGRGPADRCAAEGAPYTGENIAMGYETGDSAFEGWYNSSGHHRNILTRLHGTIGVGRSGLYWTQDFGP